MSTTNTSFFKGFRKIADDEMTNMQRFAASAKKAFGGNQPAAPKPQPGPSNVGTNSGNGWISSKIGNPFG